MIILYGIEGRYKDVTSFTKGLGNCITIPSGDNNRCDLFGGDPLPNILKHLKINDIIYEHYQSLIVNFDTDSVTLVPDPYLEKIDRLCKIHSTSVLKYGSFLEELPEQLMASLYIKPTDKVLELGGNIGRNSIVISKLLNDSSHLVTLECDSDIASQLTENRDLSHLSFHIENSAISLRKLCQRGWDTYPYDGELPHDSKSVNNITFDELQLKYSITFDTLVADCEGALFYILQDFPTLLTHIQTIIMENDYHELSHKLKVDEIITSNGFKRVYSEPGGWGPCFNYFFEVWQK
jgi:hypothetical protein